MRSLLYFCVAATGIFITAYAESLSPEEAYNLAQVYESGNDSIAPDTLKSNALYLMAAEEGYAPARNYMGFRYYLGEGIRQDTDSALFWIRKAAEDGDIKAAGNLGYLLAFAPDIEHDYEQALKWLAKASDAGLHTAHTLLADMMQRGLGIEPDTLAAIRLYEKAINIGIPDAQIRLMAMMGFKWKELPADSALSLGLKYYLGKAPVAGVDLLENAAVKGSPQAMALLGDAYSRGIGVAYNHEKSIEFFLKGALSGNPSAQFILAELLEFFPDILETPQYKAILQENTSNNSESSSPDYWYKLAHLKGISNADEAYQKLYESVNN